MGNDQMTEEERLYVRWEKGLIAACCFCVAAGVILLAWILNVLGVLP